MIYLNIFINNILVPRPTSSATGGLTWTAARPSPCMASMTRSPPRPPASVGAGAGVETTPPLAAGAGAPAGRRPGTERPGSSETRVTCLVPRVSCHLSRDPANGDPGLICDNVSRAAGAVRMEWRHLVSDQMSSLRMRRGPGHGCSCYNRYFTGEGFRLLLLLFIVPKLLIVITFR